MPTRRKFLSALAATAAGTLVGVGIHRIYRWPLLQGEESEQGGDLLDPQSFGAVYNALGQIENGDSVLLAAIANARARGSFSVRAPALTYRVRERIKLPAGMSFLSDGGWIIPHDDVTGSWEGVVLNESNAYDGGSGSREERIRVGGWKIDLNAGIAAADRPRRGIFLDNVWHCRVDRNWVQNIPDGGEGIRLSRDARYNEIVGNRTWGARNLSGSALGCVGILLVSITNDAVNSSNLPATCKHNRIADNACLYGTHGISLFNASFNQVHGGRCESNAHRGVILSPSSNFNEVEGVEVFTAGSAGVHLAHRSSYNAIRGCRVVGTTGGEGQGFKCYVGCQHNVFSRCSAIGNTTDGFMIGFGCSHTMAQDCLARGNGRHGFYLMAGYTPGGDPASAAALDHPSVVNCQAVSNGGDGVHAGAEQNLSYQITFPEIHALSAYLNRGWGLRCTASAIGVHYDGASTVRNNMAGQVSIVNAAEEGEDIS